MRRTQSTQIRTHNNDDTDQPYGLLDDTDQPYGLLISEYTEGMMGEPMLRSACFKPYRSNYEPPTSRLLIYVKTGTFSSSQKTRKCTTLSFSLVFPSVAIHAVDEKEQCNAHTQTLTVSAATLSRSRFDFLVW